MQVTGPEAFSMNCCAIVVISNNQSGGDIHVLNLLVLVLLKLAVL